MLERCEACNVKAFEACAMLNFRALQGRHRDKCEECLHQETEGIFYGLLSPVSVG
jgi:hypothetical protein